MILDLDKVLILTDSVRIQAQTDEGIDGGGLGDQLEGPALLVLELDEVAVVLDHLVPFVLGRVEQLGQREPLARHLVPVVGVDELVVVHAVGRVAFDAVDGRLA